jgi:hypothetical protein
LKLCRLCWLIAAGLLLAGIPGFPATDSYQSKNLHPERKRVLRQRIEQERAAVRTATGPEDRACRLEELCKSLIQDEDYDQALGVATEVSSMQSITQERRAAHHFLIAQIYAWKMEASATIAQMEENRENAVRIGREVLAQMYPEKWMVSDATRNLIRQLTNPSHMKEVRNGVEKRQSGGSSASVPARGAAQSQLVDKVLPKTVGPGAGESTVGQPALDALGAKMDALSAKLDGQVQAENAEPVQFPPVYDQQDSSKIHFSGGKETTYSTKPKSAAATSDKDASAANVRRITPLSSPIIIDGVSIRKAPKTAIQSDRATQ